MKRSCGCFTMASPKGNKVWASTPKIYRTFCEIRYSTTVSARFGPDMGASCQMIGLSNSGAAKKQLTSNKSFTTLSSCGRGATDEVKIVFTTKDTKSTKLGD